MVPPQLIAALIGAAIGAGKTALNKEERKKPMSWVSNTLSGAASGAAGGAGAGSAGAAAMGGLKGSMGSIFGGGGMGSMPMPTSTSTMLTGHVSNNGMPFNELQEGEMDYDDPSLPGGTIQGRVEDTPGGLSPKAQAAVDLLKSYISRPKAPAQIPIQPPEINPSLPLNVGYFMPPPVQQFRAPEPEMLSRRRRAY